MAQTPLTKKAKDPYRHGSASIPHTKHRRKNTNPKHGFCSCPAQAPSGRLAQTAGEPNRGSGKEHRVQS